MYSHRNPLLPFRLDLPTCQLPIIRVKSILDVVVYCLYYCIGLHSSKLLGLFSSLMPIAFKYEFLILIRSTVTSRIIDCPMILINFILYFLHYLLPKTRKLKHHWPQSSKLLVQIYRRGPWAEGSVILNARALFCEKWVKGPITLQCREWRRFSVRVATRSSFYFGKPLN